MSLPLSVHSVHVRVHTTLGNNPFATFLQACETPEAINIAPSHSVNSSASKQWRAAPREAAVVQPVRLALMWPNPSRRDFWTNRGRQSRDSRTASSSSTPAFSSTTTRRQSGEGTTPGETLWRYSLSFEHAFTYIIASLYENQWCHAGKVLVVKHLN